MTTPLRMSLLREQVEGSKSAVPRYWREANMLQREAICYTAKLPTGFAGLALTDIGNADRESIRLAVIGLEWQTLFHGAMSHYEWHAGCAPEQIAEEKKTAETGSAERLAKSKGLLMSLVNNSQTANCGQ